MLRKESEAVPESNGPVPQQEEFGSSELTLVGVYRMFKERFDRWDRKLDNVAKYWQSMDQRLAGLEPDARHPRLAMVADGQANTKTRERPHGGSCSADRIDPDPMCSTSFGNGCTEPPAPPCSGENALVDKGAAAPNSCLPSLKMRTTTAASGSLPPAKPLRQQRSPSTGHLFGFT